MITLNSHEMTYSTRRYIYIYIYPRIEQQFFFFFSSVKRFCSSERHKFSRYELLTLHLREYFGIAANSRHSPERRELREIRGPGRAQFDSLFFFVRISTRNTVGNVVEASHAISREQTQFARFYLFFLDEKKLMAASRSCSSLPVSRDTTSVYLLWLTRRRNGLERRTISRGEHLPLITHGDRLSSVFVDCCHFCTPRGFVSRRVKFVNSPNR